MITKLFKQNNLEPFAPIDNQGKFTNEISLLDKELVVMKLRDDVNKALEEAREEKLISKGFEAILSIQIDKDEYNISAMNDLAQIFIVNEIKFINDISNAKQYELAKINVVKNDD
ncbi:hypothetical protein FQA39_LY12904 [Lamprigera yunnana]|nr:hypothetical protein FQA39_LY12904 [Lamprigera yunnana]